MTAQPYALLVWLNPQTPCCSSSPRVHKWMLEKVERLVSLFVPKWKESCLR